MSSEGVQVVENEEKNDKREAEDELTPIGENEEEEAAPKPKRLKRNEGTADESGGLSDASNGEEEAKSSEKDEAAAVSHPEEEDDEDDFGEGKQETEERDESKREASDEEDEPQEQELDDFDRAVQSLKKRSQRRKKGDELNPTQLTAVENLLRKMRDAAEKDVEDNNAKKPALNKIKMLDEITIYLMKKNLHSTLLDEGVLGVLQKWLAPLPDKSLPNMKVRETIYNILLQFPTADTEELRASGIGKEVMSLWRHPQETQSNKKKANTLIQRWSRKVFQSSERPDAEDSGHMREPMESETREVMSRTPGTSITTTAREDVDIIESVKESDSAPKSVRYHARIPQKVNMDFKFKPQSPLSAEEAKQMKKAPKTLNKFEKKFQAMRGGASGNARGMNMSIEGRNDYPQNGQAVVRGTCYKANSGSLSSVLLCTPSDNCLSALMRGVLRYPKYRPETPNNTMKRQRTEMYESVSTIEDTALSIVLSSEKAMLVVAFSTEGPYLKIINQIARELLSQLWEMSNIQAEEPMQKFWSSVEATARGEKDLCDTLKLSGNHIRIKYRRAEVKAEPIVVVSAKKVKGRDDSIPFGLSGLMNALEEDIVGKVLGMTQINASLVEMPVRGVHKYLVTNRNLASVFSLTDAHSMRGKNWFELGQLSSDSAMIYDMFKNYNDPKSKTATSSLELDQFPNITFMSASREIIPNVFLCLSITHNRSASRLSPRPPAIPRAGVPKSWMKNRWDYFMEDCIHFIDANRQHASQIKCKLPDEFLNDANKVFVYAYRSEQPFLPSGNSDGYTWKSSRNIACTGNLQRKYHYADLRNGKKLRRRVMWLKEVKDTWMVEYRHFECNNNSTEADNLIGPKTMDWPTVLNEIYSQTAHQLLLETDKIASHFDMGDTRVEQSDLGTHNVVTYVSDILHNWASEYGKSCGY
ncbi:hypothetical protein PROFUN_03141 [Planoprotostelium fungivorum]|uniref:TFIIS N-terminal domain-containing protein n=1 Tax=Planoprotostelium fungivorum TaxID=1890364 RepID=A0A2P6NQD6_9EUKA|nr:hypothetical protein PROFUN_03141 [Planoprotostelium fungivorum]